MSYEVSKSEDGEHFLTAVILIPNQKDLQDDVIAPIEIERAVHRYNAGRKRVMKNHSSVLSEADAEVAESFVSPVEMTINGQRVPQGSWIVKFKVSERIYQHARQGEISGFSVGGQAEQE